MEAHKSNRLLSWSGLVFLMLVLKLVGGQFGLIKTQLVKAQTPPSVSSLSPAELDQHIRDLRQLYANQIDTYRINERKYQLALTEYQQLQTLSAKEKAVTASVATDISRADVLITYFELLHAQMVAATGMSPHDKQQLSPQLITMINQFKTHRQQASQITSQDGVNQSADDFKPLLATATNLAAKVQFLLDLAQLNSQRQQAKDLFVRVKQKQEELPLSAIQRAERSRAYNQIETLFDQVDTQIQTNNALALATDAKIQKQRDQLSEALTSIETDLIKALNYLRELANVL